MRVQHKYIKENYLLNNSNEDINILNYEELEKKIA
jgi:hypothetical protein